MARGRRSISIDEKIEQKKKEVLQAKEKYDTLLAELNALQKKKNELRNKELLKAVEKSNRSMEEILAFLAGNNEEN